MSPRFRTRLALNGTWRIQPSDEALPPATWIHAVPVPGLVDLAEPRYEWKKFRHHYYQCLFDVDDNKALAFLVIEQAMFGTEVWLNGEHLGGDIACYTSQEYDLRHALKPGTRNELVVRVGQKEHLPPHSAAGKDQERTEWIPGIWGDVYIVQCGNPRVKLVQVIPLLDSASAEVRLTIENRSDEPVLCTAVSTVFEKKSARKVGESMETTFTIRAQSAALSISTHAIAGMNLWSPDSPFLYEVETVITCIGKTVDAVRTTFGMREFKIVGSDFHLNGTRIFLKGGNIAFHRFLSDADRGTLPWNQEWIRKLLIDPYFSSLCSSMTKTESP